MQPTYANPLYTPLGQQVYNPLRNDSGSFESFDRRGVSQTPLPMNTPRDDWNQQDGTSGKQDLEADNLAYSANTRDQILRALDHRKPEIRNHVKCLLTTDMILFGLIALVSLLLTKLSWFWLVPVFAFCLFTAWALMGVWIIINENECFPTSNQILDNYACTRLLVSIFTMVLGIFYLYRAAIRSGMFEASTSKNSPSIRTSADQNIEDAGTFLFWIVGAIFFSTSMYLSISSIRMIKTISYWKFLAGRGIWENNADFEGI